jgi:TatD DNase family protein
MFVDSHAHLEMPQFDADRGEVFFRAQEAGVETVVAIGSGTGPGSLDCGIQLAQGHDWIYATIGIHPHEARLATEADFQELEQLAKRPKVAARGATRRLPATDGAGAGGQAAHRDPLPALAGE